MRERHCTYSVSCCIFQPHFDIRHNQGGRAISFTLRPQFIPQGNSFVLISVVGWVHSSGTECENFKQPYRQSNPEPPILWRSALTNYSCLTLTSTLERRGGQRPRMSPYPLYRRSGGSQSSSARVLKISPPSEYVPWTVEAVASRKCVVLEVNSLA